MDDMILNIAMFQNEHFVDRSGMLGGGGGTPGASATENGNGVQSGNDSRMKVLLVSFDRNMRSKARSRGIDAADEKDLQDLVG